MRPAEAPCVIPLWINGRACLRLTARFHEVRCPISGKVLRKLALCGDDDLHEALAAARRALPEWKKQEESARRLQLALLGNALEVLAGHFSGLLAEETGIDATEADTEVGRAVRLLREAKASGCAGAAIVAGAGKSFDDMVGQIVALLAAGGTLVVCPALDAPSALLALAELSGRCGFPAGVVNVVFPDDEVLMRLQAGSGGVVF